LAAQPDQPDALHLLGVLAHQTGHADAAIDLIGKAIALAPYAVDAHVHLGLALKASGRLAAAIASFHKALAIAPDHAGAHDSLGVALQKAGRIDEAIFHHRRAVERDPESAIARNNFGNALLIGGRAEEAVEVYRQALAKRPDLGAGHGNLGSALQALGRYAKARAALDTALTLDPRDSSAWNNLGLVRQVQGDHAGALAAFRQAVELDPKAADAVSNIIFTLDLMPEASGAEALAARRDYANRFAAGFAWPRHGNSRDPERRLRVGYVSADFRRHSAASAFAPVLLAHDPAAIEVIAYSATLARDEMTARLRKAIPLWRDIAGLDDDELAARVQADGVDILVDLSGHSAGNRLRAFARKPAPVQVTAFGHALGTGLGAIDAIFLDPVVCPREHFDHFVERVAHLPSLICFDAPDGAPDVGPLPLLDNGFATFGCFNRLHKVTEACFDTFATILREAPTARFKMKDAMLDDPANRTRVIGAFAKRGIEAERIALQGFTDRRGHLAAYGAVDLTLDPFPQGGGISALESLWMGVPPIALLGERVQSRGVASFLTQLDLSDFIATTPEGYVAAARGAVADATRLAAFRAGLRDRMRASPLADARAYTRAVEAAYRALWRNWCFAVGSGQ
ncbi:MAG: tetratricopeptide repeat protein, partial [Alphaproteobacteria bacterium]|nr:tetratricopeptide repeat protein [Alphaproteobacteria bacterium]